MKTVLSPTGKFEAFPTDLGWRIVEVATGLVAGYLYRIPNAVTPDSYSVSLYFDDGSESHFDLYGCPVEDHLAEMD